MPTLPTLFLPKLRHFGLSIGRTSLRAVEVDQNGRVQSSAEIELPEGILESSGVLLKKDVFTDSVKKLVAIGKFTTNYVAVCFSEVYAYNRESRLPLIPKEEMNEAVSWRIKELFPFPETELYFDWRLLDTTEKEFHVSVVAVQKKVLDPLVEALVNSGLKPLSFEPGASAIARLLVLKPEECVLLAQINRKGAYVTLVKGGEALFTTVVNFTTQDTPETYLSNIVQSILEIAAFYQSKGILKKESTSVLLTGELATNEWANAITQKCTYPVRILKTQIQNPAFNKAYVAATTKIVPPLDEHSVNLLPDKIQRQYDNERTTRFYKSLLTRALVVVSAMVVFSLGAFIAVTIERQRLETQVNQLTEKNKLQGENSQGLLLLNANAKNIVALAPLRKTPKMELSVIERITPAGVTITQWEYDDNKLLYTLSGVAKSRNELLLFKNKLEQSDEFTKITLPLESLVSPENVTFTLSFISQK